MSTHTVKQGEYLSLIARNYGISSWKTIYDHPNNAAFRKKRPDPNLIYPGDVLYIPDGKDGVSTNPPAPGPGGPPPACGVDYQVPGPFLLVAQKQEKDCWAAVYTMMARWKFHNQWTIKEALGQLDPVFLQKYENEEDLKPHEIPYFLFRARLVAEQPGSLTAAGWADLLRAHGPLWVGTMSTDFGNLHSRMVIGIRGDGTLENTWVSIADPDGRRFYKEQFAGFLVKYEEGYTWGANPDYRQIRHW